MAAVAMVGAVPYVGPVLIGLVFFAFLGVAFVLMLLLLGILGGFNLLYPTIAVEGADAFDAMSRSFAYVYARPWRLLFYTVTALVYGVVTFLFVSFAVYLVFSPDAYVCGLGHGFVRDALRQPCRGCRHCRRSGPSRSSCAWSRPVNWYAMDWPECIGSCCCTSGCIC